MFTLIDTDKDTTFLIGDVHGQFKAIGNWVKQNGLSNCNVIFCGDFGLGFSSLQEEMSLIKKTDKICHERNVDCYAIRGNHDDPSYYKDGACKVKFNNIELLSDYTVLKTPLHNILCVGGAISIDRFKRLEEYNKDVFFLMHYRHYGLEKATMKAKKCYWDDEPFHLDTVAIDEIKKANINIDTVVTHSAPDFCEPIAKNNVAEWMEIDKELEEDLNKERTNITTLYNLLKENGNNVTNWFYGHFHKHYNNVINGTKFIGLDMGRLGKYGGGVGGFFDMVELR